MACVGEALRAAAARLRASGSRSPRLDAELLLGDVLSLERVALFSHPDRPLSSAEVERFERLLRRREAHEPVAYLRGRRGFRTLELEVTPAVLIPRPETETLVEVALDELVRAQLAAPLALDLGTGSGCIALALAAEHPSVRVVAVEVQEAALEVARRNVVRCGLGERVRVVRSDLFEALSPPERFDLIVSNPPYIPEAEYVALEQNVREYEPRCALHGGDDGLSFYRRIVPEAAGWLRQGGLLALEVGYGQAAAVGELIAATGLYDDAVEYADLAGVSRVVTARRGGGSARAE